MTVIIPNVFVNGTTIEASEVNENFTVLALAVDNTLPRDGSLPMLAALPLVFGTVTAPGLGFSSDTNTGLYRKAADTIGFTGGGTEIFAASSAGIVLNTLKVSGLAAATVNGDAVRYEQVIGVFQPLDATLTAFAALSIAADKLPYGSGVDTFSLADFTTAGRAILDDANAAAQRVTLSAALKGAWEAVNAQTGATYTLALVDAGALVTMNNAAANVVTIPANASVAFDVGAVLSIQQIGAGATTVDGDTGVTVNGVSAGGAAINARYMAVTITKIATNTWLMAGSHGTVA